MYIVHVQLPHLKVKILDNNKTILRKENPTSRLEKQKEVLTSTNGSLAMLIQIIYDCCSQTNAFTDQTVTAVGCSSIRKWLANWGAATTGSQRWSSWWLWGWPEGVKTNFCWTKCIWQGYFAKKMDQIAHFCPEWWFKHFTPAYRGSPPPAVFQNKYQKRNMKEIQQGNLLVDYAPGHFW